MLKYDISFSHFENNIEKLEAALRKRRNKEPQILFKDWTKHPEVREWNSSICLAYQKETWAVTWLEYVRTFTERKHRLLKCSSNVAEKGLALRKSLTLNPDKFKLRISHKYLTVMVINHWYYWSHCPSLSSFKLNLGAVLKIYFCQTSPLSPSERIWVKSYRLWNKRAQTEPSCLKIYKTYWPSS